MPRPRQPSPDELKLQRDINTLQLKLLRANSALRLKTIYAERLELLLRKRTGQIDELNGKIERLREQNKRLDQECEHLVEMVRLEPPHLSAQSSA